jgi:hypothetical protein
VVAGGAPATSSSPRPDPIAEPPPLQQPGARVGLGDFVAVVGVLGMGGGRGLPFPPCCSFLSVVSCFCFGSVSAGRPDLDRRRACGRPDRGFSALMAADSSMGFHQGLTASSLYNHHMLSFQSSGGDAGVSGAGAGMVMAPSTVSGTSSTAGLYLPPSNGVVSNSSGAGPSRSSSGDVVRGSKPPKYKFVTGPPSDWSDQELSILKEGLVR